MRREIGNRTLPELDAEFGVSHETVRAICRRERDTARSRVRTDASRSRTPHDSGQLTPRSGRQDSHSEAASPQQ